MSLPEGFLTPERLPIRGAQVFDGPDLHGPTDASWTVDGAAGWRAGVDPRNRRDGRGRAEDRPADVITAGHLATMPVATRSTLSSETVRGLVEAARRRGLLTVAHIGSVADAELAVTAGVDGLAGPPAAASLPGPLLEAMIQQDVFMVSTLGRHFPPGDKPVLDDPVTEVLSATARARLASTEVVDRDGTNGSVGWSRSSRVVCSPSTPCVRPPPCPAGSGVGRPDPDPARAAGRHHAVDADPTQDTTTMRRVVRSSRLGHPTDGPAASALTAS